MTLKGIYTERHDNITSNFVIVKIVNGKIVNQIISTCYGENADIMYELILKQTNIEIEVR